MPPYWSASLSQVAYRKIRLLAINSGGLGSRLIHYAGLYTDESPGLKVDPFVVLVLSVGFIISVVALHSKLPFPNTAIFTRLTILSSHCKGHKAVLFIERARKVSYCTLGVKAFKRACVLLSKAP